MQPDANVGGPIVIPKVYNGRNKTFFFFGYKKLIEKKTQAYTSQTPTPDELSGDFTFGGAGPAALRSLHHAPDRGRHLDARSIPEPIIPQNRFDPVAAKILVLQHPGAAEHAGFVQQHRAGEQLHLQSALAHLLRGLLRTRRSPVQREVQDYGSYTYNHQNGLRRPTSIRSRISTAPPAISRRSPSRILRRRHLPFQSHDHQRRPRGILPGPERHARAFVQPELGRKLGIPNISPAADAVIHRRALGVGTYTVAPITRSCTA